MGKMKDIHITAQEIARDYGLPTSGLIVDAIACAFIEGYSARWIEQVALSDLTDKVKS
jgi:hypothetical protein